MSIKINDDMINKSDIDSLTTSEINFKVGAYFAILTNLKIRINLRTRNARKSKLKKLRKNGRIASKSIILPVLKINFFLDTDPS